MLDCHRSQSRRMLFWSSIAEPRWIIADRPLPAVVHHFRRGMVLQGCDSLSFGFSRRSEKTLMPFVQVLRRMNQAIFWKCPPIRLR